MTPTNAIPTIYTMDQVGGAATFEDITSARQELAPCRIKDCTTAGRIALGGKNFCAVHGLLILEDFPQDELDYLCSTGWVSAPLSLYDAPPNLTPKISLSDTGPVFI